MKRSVAILGPTPAFVRWAIERPCHLREIDSQRLPETTFRQLRSLREMSVAMAQDRFVDNVCLHPSARSDEPESALGFLMNEIVGLHGGLEIVQQTCRSCPANVGAKTSRGSELIAGCYGWLPLDSPLDSPVDSQFDLNDARQNSETIASPKPLTDFDVADVADVADSLSDRIERAIAELGITPQLDQYFPATNPNWYRLWTQPVPSAVQLQLIEAIFIRVVACQSQRPGESGLHQAATHQSTGKPNLSELDRFSMAVSAFRKNDQPLHLELVPAGHSDGQHWTIEPHCRICKSSTAKASGRCRVCGVTGQRQNAIKLKVLGLRPYLHLHSVFGASATQELLQRFESRRY